jgi:hypothetical protein
VESLTPVIGRVLDFHLALARHLVARFRRRFINADSPVFSFADERDFAKFCRELKKPITDPVMRRLLEEDVDWLWDVECYRSSATM